MDKERFAAQAMAMEHTLYGVARTYLADVEDCADAVQEALLKAWKNHHTLRQDAYFGTWLVRILINQCKTMLREKKRQVPTTAEPAENAPVPEGADPAVYESVFSLPLPYRVPFVLHYIEGYSTKEIAGMLSLPKGTVVSRLHRARARLRDANVHEEVFPNEA